jgi:hypothetical protein
MIAAFAFYPGQNPKQNKNYRETNQTDTDEGQITQRFPPWHKIGFVMASKKGGNSLRTAPRFWTLTN